MKMADLKHSSPHIQIQVQPQQQTQLDQSTFARFNQVAPTQAEETNIQVETTTGKFCNRLFLVLFSLHLLFIFLLIIILTIRGLRNAAGNNHQFRPIHWYPPLLVSCLCAVVAAVGWQVVVFRHPKKTIEAAFWLGPSLTFALSLLLFSTTTDAGLVAAAFFLILAIIQSLYACWVTRRREYASHILSASLLATQNTVGTTNYVFLALVSAVIYSILWISGVSNAIGTGIRFSALYAIALLISLAWTMNVIRYTLYVAIARVGYLYFTTGVEIGTRLTVRDAVSGLFGLLCQGSAIAPIIELFRGFARTMALTSGDTDEFMFSCVHCYMGVADRLVIYGNRWGFVQMGVYEKGFVQASADTWKMFVQLGMVPLIDRDLTGSFCFLCGVAGGALSAIAGGSWAFAVNQDYATSVSVCSFLMGYCMCRITMAWPQACVSAYYVAYAENPQSHRFDSSIPDQIRALQADRR